MTLELQPLTLAEAHAFVRQQHRHHSPSVGGKFAIGVNDGAGHIVGVVVVGRPVARHFDNGWTAEVTRRRRMARATPAPSSMQRPGARRGRWAIGG